MEKGVTPVDGMMTLKHVMDNRGSLLGDLSNEMAGKAVMFRPAIAVAILLGPVGIALGLATSVVMAASRASSDSPPSDSERSEK
jgi:hypothetical protein